MFERYTEKARRVIFFARYEASQFGSPYIETEHLLLGLLREDKALTNRILRSYASVESIRMQIEAHSVVREKVSTSVDLPLANDCKRVLAYAAEEAARLSHTHIGTEHLLLGLLREDKGFAAEILTERGVTLAAVRAEAAAGPAPIPRGLRQKPPPPERMAPVRFVKTGATETLFEQNSLPPAVNATVVVGEEVFRVEDVRWVYERGPGSPAEIFEVKERIDTIVAQMESAIANHEFEKARFYSEEERKEREKMRVVLEQFVVDETTGTYTRKDGAEFTAVGGSAELKEIVVSLVKKA